MKHNPGFLALVNDAKSRVKQIDIDQYKKMAAGDHVLIDTREDREWEAGHATGAVHLSKGVIERDVETQIPDKSATLVADALQKMGYKNAISLDGGWRAWNEAGLPTEK
jgi:rhodanese-related sulfurtransferase